MTDEATPGKLRLTEGLGPEVADRTLVERLRFLASGQDDPHSVAIDESADAIERMQNWLEGDCYCPCCTERHACADGCTFETDDPSGYERMAGAREAMYGPNAALTGRPLGSSQTRQP